MSIVIDFYKIIVMIHLPLLLPQVVTHDEGA